MTLRGGCDNLGAVTTHQLRSKYVKPKAILPMASSPTRIESGTNQREGFLPYIHPPNQSKFVSKIPRRKSETHMPPLVTSNQQEERTPPKPKQLDKHQQYLKDLEEKKRKEKEEELAKEEKQRRMRLKLRKTILQRAASIRVDNGPTEADVDQPQDSPSSKDEDCDDNESNLTEEELKAKALARKKLLQKQQALLESMQSKRKKEEEEAEIERQKAAKKKEAARKASLGAQEVSSRMQDALEKFNQGTAAAAGSAISAIRVKKVEKKDGEDSLSLTPEDKEKRALQQEAIKKKQLEYLQKLADERKQKQIEEEERQEALRLKRAKVREEALQRHEAAKAAAAIEKAMETPAPPPPEEDKPKVDVEAMISRLTKLKPTEAQLIPEAKDFASWKKRNGISPDTKVFCLTGWYPVIKETLEKRGWYHNPDRNSPYFDLKWALKSDDLKNVKLNEDQLVNHFLQNTAITTKVGLLHNLRNITWFQSEDIDSFFPRAYDLNEPSDMQAYIQDFRYIHAEGMLKRLGVRCKAFLDQDTPLNVNLGVLDVLLSVCRKRLEILPDDVLDNNEAGRGIEPLATELQWEVLQRCPIDAPSSIRAGFVYVKPVVQADSSGDQPAIQPQNLTPSEQREEAKAAKRLDKALENAFIKEKARLNELLGQIGSISIETAQEVLTLLQGLEELCPRFHLNGSADVCKNVWIVKPAGMSRGRGIRVFNQLKELLEYADVENHKECQWIVQKYIENPLLVCNRKFDIRQWVFVTSWNPLTVWFYLDCYLRFSSEEYQVNDLSDQFVHLTNNSIQKYGENFNRAYTTEDGSMTVEGNMWHSDDLEQYLTKRFGLDKETGKSIFAAKIQPRMKEIVKWSLSCVQDMVQHRKNSCELYGYDFMLDENFKPWLIEVNSSPACDYSTAVTKRYIQTGLEDILKVMLDVREYENAKRKNGGQTKLPKPDTGRWENIHKADYIPKPMSTFGGAEFEIKGTKMTKKTKRTSTLIERPIQEDDQATIPIDEVDQDIVSSLPPDNDEQDAPEVDELL